MGEELEKKRQDIIKRRNLINKIKRINNKDKIDKFIINWKDTLAFLQTMIIIIGIFGGLYWFYEQGETRPRVIILHELAHRKIDENIYWVHVSVKIQNIGKIPVCIDSGKVWIQKIIPLEKDIIHNKINCLNDIDNQVCIVNWPPACQKYIYKLDEKLLIEPGETDRKSYEYFVSSNLKTIKVYSYFENPQKSWWQFWKKSKAIGWDQVTIYDLK